MDVVGVDDTMLEDLHDRDNALRLRGLVQKCLTPREAEIIRLRYGLGGTVPLTQREVASSFGISRSYVSRIEKRATGKTPHRVRRSATAGRKRGYGNNIPQPLSQYFRTTAATLPRIRA